MKTVTVGNTVLEIKDYYCDDGGGYLQRDDNKLWLYINITDICNAHCPFCINPCRSARTNPFDQRIFRQTLISLKDHISGISLTGGEPMLFPEIIDDVIGIITEVFTEYIEIDIVTNGFRFREIGNLKHLDELDSIHLSRHMITDSANNEVFGIPVATAYTIQDVLSSLSDPAKVVFNCILMKNGIDSIEGMAAFLEFAADTGVRNTSFIGMAPVNQFCIDNYVDPACFRLMKDKRFSIWNSQQDHKFCKCSSGSYRAKKRSVRFYYRCIGSQKASYARQLVYTADNKLLAGFGGKEIHFEE